jgi:DNA-binding NtrC family response regulator
MKPRLVLLLTRDNQFQKLLSDVLLDDSAIVVAKHSVSGALQLVCSRGSELDLVVIDFDDGCHGMTLLSAIKDCCEDLPIVVVTSRNMYHAAVVAYANGVEACLAKPITATDLRLVMAKLGAPKALLTAV